MLASLSKVIADSGELRRRSGIAPVWREPRNFNSFRLQVCRNLRDGKYQVLRRIVLIEVNEVFKLCQRLVL